MLWTNLGGYLASTQFDKKWRAVNQPLVKFRQFCAKKADFKKNAGESMNFDVFTNLASAGGTLTETNTMTKGTFSVAQGTLSVDEWGNAVGWSGKAEALSMLSPKAAASKLLLQDKVKVLDSNVEAQMDLCSYRYVGSTTDTGNFTSDGTATATAAVNMSKFHLQEMVDKLQELNTPGVDGGEFYVMLSTIKSKRGLHDSLEAFWQYTKFPLNGEVGKYYRCRVAWESSAMNNAIGTNGVTGETYMFGGDAAWGLPVMEGVALPEGVRYQVPQDFGRSKGLAWYAILGHALIEKYTPDYQCIKWDSA